MDLSTGALAQNITTGDRSGVICIEQLVWLERRLMNMAEDIPATAINPMHQTRAFPGLMLEAAVCTGCLIGRLSQHLRPGGALP
ncbi:MAG: hypothetical protein K0S45_2641 [Nitrospira sp.]|jgi:hypothetical protein|nr:hypothetical protein [Nitrospira sp.]